MKNNFDKIDQTLDIKATITAKEIIKQSKKEIKIIENKDHSELDYDYIRGTLYNLIEKGQEAATSLLELAQDGQQPRAYEVFGQLIKSVADSTDKLMDIHQKVKELKKDPNLREKTAAGDELSKDLMLARQNKNVKIIEID